MKTEIFKDSASFYKREDKDVNGVTAEFASLYPNYEDMNSTNKACWNCSDCSDCSDCSGERYKENIKNKELPETISEAGFIVPVIENIHAKVLQAVKSTPEAFDMGDWHTCDTTHCRAGWVVHLAGEAGYKLEGNTSTVFSAMQIYHASNPDVPVSPTRFYETNKIAMADIERCAHEEINKTK